MQRLLRWPLVGVLAVSFVVVVVLSADRQQTGGAAAPLPLPVHAAMRAAGPPGWLVLSPAGDVASPAPLMAIATPGYEGPVVIDVRLADGRGFRANTAHRSLPWPDALSPLAVGATGRITVTARGTTLAAAAFRRVATQPRPQGLANARLPAPRQW